MFTTRTLSLLLVLACAPPGPVGSADPPRPLFPLSSTVVSGQRPTLRWESTSARTWVELCRARACGDVTLSFPVEGASAAPPEDLAPGVWFWRLRAERDGVLAAQTSATWQLTVGAASAPRTSSGSTVTDVNGDGLADLLVADWRTETVRVFYGAAKAVAELPTILSEPADAGSSLYGRTVSAAGDVNGDGYCDVLVGAPRSVNGAHPGRVYVYLGGPGGLGTAPAATMEDPDTGVSLYAESVAAAGDVNGDGYADFASSAELADVPWGRVYLYAGGPTLGSQPAWRLKGEEAYDGPEADKTGRFGAALAADADFDGDGFSDLAVSAPRAGRQRGQVLFFLGSREGPALQPSRTLRGPTDDAQLGEALVTGDFDGDGLFDLAVSFLDPGAPWADRFLTHIRSGAGSDAVLRPGAAAVATAVVDANRDGAAELLLAEPSFQADRGRLFVYAGGPGGLGATPPRFIDNPDNVTLNFGAALGMGDADGDGFADVAVRGYSKVFFFGGGERGLSSRPFQTLAPVTGYELGRTGR